MTTKPKTQKLSIRLLKKDLEPEDSLREGVTLEEWSNIKGAKISTGRMGGINAPKWTTFLDLTEKEKDGLHNSTTYGIVFIQTKNRWFAVSFGMGHVKLDPDKFEQNFGLRIVLNTVDPNQLKSADIRTPDENTLTRRSQTSRGSDQTAFNIDLERDIVHGLAGVPRVAEFGLWIAGKDALTINRKIVVDDLPQVCSEAYANYNKEDYKESFSWIDRILHVRNSELIEKLDAKLVDVLDEAIKSSSIEENLHLAFPVVYDPDKTNHIKYKGFRSSNVYPDLDLCQYFEALRERGKTEYLANYLTSHTVHEVDDGGRDCGGKWNIHECLCFETVLDKHTYVLSGGLWYQVDVELADQVKKFFEKTDRIDLPPAKAGENEETYNSRIATAGDTHLLCLDRKLIRPTGSTSSIEVCDFISREKHLIHVKNKTSSSRLSHLFNQGTVAARVLILDSQSRDKVREKIKEVELKTERTGYESILPSSTEEFHPAAFTFVYAVISIGNEAKLPFFSLVSFRQAARDLHALGYKYAFSWIERPSE